MPKNIIDYSNTIIYKIYCKDDKITELYVGHTTNFSKRKYHHKLSCNNLNNNYKIYNIIRENGGWENWDMVEIAKYNCNNNTEARMKEQEHYELLKATLNSCSPFSNKQKYFCNDCNIQCYNLKNYEKHTNCDKHKNKNSVKTEYLETNNCIKNICNNIKSNSEKEINFKYFCEKCYYYTDRKSNLDNHNKSNKHKKMLSGINNKYKSLFNCNICNKKYVSSTGLYKHKKKCNINKLSDEETKISEFKECIKRFIEENSEIKKIMKLILIKNNITV